MMSGLAPVMDRLWRDGVGPDDRRALAALLLDPALADAPELAELATFCALVEVMAGVAAAGVPPPVAGAPARVRALAAAAAVGSAALAREEWRVARALHALDRALGDITADDPSCDAAHGWADLAIAEAALFAGEPGVARQRLEAVARGAAPEPLRAIAMVRAAMMRVAGAELEESRRRCRYAEMLAGDARPLLGQQARVAGAILDYVAGDCATAAHTLRAEAKRGEIGATARTLLAALDAPDRALPLLAEGLADASRRADSLAYMVYTLVGARRYRVLERDADALLTLTAAMLELQPTAQVLSDVLADERRALRDAWGAVRYAAAETGALALLATWRAAA